jgi:hypothetical protein
MGAAAERVDIREVMGIAINARNLGEDITGATLRPVDRLAAFGLAGCTTLNRRLAEAMWRVRWGKDRRSRKEAGEMFASLLLRSSLVRRKWNIWKPSEQLARFALAMVIEWEHDKCPQCGGAGSIPRSKGRDIRLHCGVCRGGGRRRANHADRAMMMGISMGIYEKHWQRRCDEALALLDQIEAEIVGPLQARLKRA